MIKKLILCLLLAATAAGAWAQINLTVPKDMPTKLVYSNRGVTIRESPSTTARKLEMTWQASLGDYKCEWVSSSASNACALYGYATFIEEIDGWYKITYHGLDAYVSSKYCSLTNIGQISATEFAKYVTSERLQQCPGKYKDYYLRAIVAEQDWIEVSIVKYIDGKIVRQYLTTIYLSEIASKFKIEKGNITMGRNFIKRDETVNFSKLTEADIDQLWKESGINSKPIIFAKINGKITQVDLQ